MIDEELEERLARYRPSAPPPDLRERVIAVMSDSEPVALGYWLASIGAVAATVVFYMLSAGIQGDIRKALTVPDQARQELVDELTVTLGGDDRARETAEWLVQIEELKRAQEPEPQVVEPGV